MRLAYVMINVEVGATDEVLEEVRGIPEVKEAHLIYGVYDIIVRVEAETVQGLKDIVTFKIRSIDNVRSTLTLVCT